MKDSGLLAMACAQPSDWPSWQLAAGRMVRTPLAHTVEDDDVLNTASLFLPHYDKTGPQLPKESTDE